VGNLHGFIFLNVLWDKRIRYLREWTQELLSRENSTQTNSEQNAISVDVALERRWQLTL